ncbi:MAG: hydrolase 1, exosortase A system-associated [Halioglobus sp.]|nr:hydrolase 1, exosortase A system-associated [Halioglobus sp.]
MGIVHQPNDPIDIGVVTIIAGGPQYRAGVGRGMVSTARYLAEQGVAVLRFDYRGLGDSGGEFCGFEHISEDLQAAVSALRCAVPEVRKVVLWGGCDAASGAMIHAWKLTDVMSMVLGNPWVTTHETHSAAMKQHYLGRLREMSFWRKVFRFEYNFAEYAAAAAHKLRENLFARAKRVVGSSSLGIAGGDQSFVDRMLEGFARFEGPVLFLISGQSVASREFDELIKQDLRWRDLCSRSASKRLDFPEADQTFSDERSRDCVNKAIVNWMQELSSKTRGV